MLATIAVVVTAGVGVATAPKTTSAQAQVEAGLAAIEEQQAAGGQAPSPEAGSDTGAAGTQTGWNPGRGLAGRDAAAQAADTASSTGPAWSPDLAEPPGDVITALGDSVMSGAAPAMYERFPGIIVQASPNLQWKDAPAMVRQGIDDGSLRRVVVLNFGTNAGLEDEAQRAAMMETLDLLGPDRRVVLVGIVGISYWVPDANAQMRAVADERDNVAYAAWDQVVAGAPGLLHDDRTHPNMDGIAAYADLVASIATELGPGA